MAVEALSRFSGGQRIIVTPGMIELGEKQHELNRQLGRYIARGADVAIIVGQYNRDALLGGIADEQKAARESGIKDYVIDDDKVVAVDSFAEAQKYLATIMKAGDTVLYENDLPDTFK